jgi:outer membrane protein assembly factor BamA
VGGDDLIETSVELRWVTPLEGLGVAVFFDLGQLALRFDNPSTNTSGGLQYGPGLGFRYHTPLGPIRLDFAYRISHLDTHPVLVDISNVPTSGVATNSTSYRLSTECGQGAGGQRFQCYGESRFQFFLTLGEPY